MIKNLHIFSNLWFYKRWMSTVARRNVVNIQMLSDSLYKQLFAQRQTNRNTSSELENESFELIKKHLNRHGQNIQCSSAIRDIDLQLPKLNGSTINDHFIYIATEQIKEYKNFIIELVNCSLPPLPEKWSYSEGWTKYFPDGSMRKVDFPNDRGLVFDIECLMSEGNFPTMATAASSQFWYSWVSKYVIDENSPRGKAPRIEDLIPLETFRNSTSPPGSKWTKRLVVGHNVSFDRSFVKEQYLTQGTLLRFLDTMSIHIAVCGQTSFQRLLHKASNSGSERKEIAEHAQKQKVFKMKFSDGWKKIGSMNNLRDVHQLHCGGSSLDKSARNVFIDGTMSDVRAEFQDLMTYCANDVKATHGVFVQLWPQFTERFPHPVTLAGMLELGSAYLPVNENWLRYIQQANGKYDEFQKEEKKLLMSLANDACSYLNKERYKEDPWLWDLDWSTKQYKLNKTARDRLDESDIQIDKSIHDRDLRSEVTRIYSTSSRVPKNPVFMPGYPLWYRDLCPKPKDKNFYYGPVEISTRVRVTPKLMRLTWKGYPLHFSEEHGWGYLSLHEEQLEPLEKELESQETQSYNHPFPIQSFYEVLRENQNLEHLKSVSTPEFLSKDFDEDAMEPEERILHWEHSLKNKKAKKRKTTETGPFDIGIPKVRFHKIPHKDGPSKKVGNPLSKDFLSRVEDGTLRASASGQADHILKLGKKCSYWKNSWKRITNQMAVWLEEKEIDRAIKESPAYPEYELCGAIIPRIVSAGTVTRRAVEPTWLTASNAYEDRIGSELKAMIQSPPGYHFVGADVDSQELWIASLFGDAYFMKEHGCTALGWMTLQGDKSNRTDLHSKTADIVNISRDHAKVLNYARIYGAGKSFAETLLLQFNPQLSTSEAKKKANEMYKQTKGIKNSQKKWIGGTESFMFNALESIANADEPKTPVLGCRMSKSLEPAYVGDDFLTSRVNWVVQSSAVDFLHLMLVCMRWLINEYRIEGRFCVSIHDEVRYLVQSEDRYRAALALQITNLLTRSMFAHQLGMNDLPQSVAFFSAVDIDTCLRKEVFLDCVTPSNPHGLQEGYNIRPGEALSIYDIVEKTNGDIGKV